MSHVEIFAVAIPVTRQTAIAVGHVYRSKHPRLTASGEVNDREVTIPCKHFLFRSPGLGVVQSCVFFEAA